VCNRSGKAGQNDGWHHEEKYAQQALLLGNGQRRDHQTDAHGRKQEAEQAKVKSQETASKGNMEPKDGNNNNQRPFERAHQKSRQSFAEKDLRWTHGSYKKLVEGSHLSLARDRKDGCQQAYQKSQNAADAWNDEPLRVEVGIEPCAI